MSIFRLSKETLASLEACKAECKEQFKNLENNTLGLKKNKERIKNSMNLSLMKLILRVSSQKCQVILKQGLRTHSSPL